MGFLTETDVFLLTFLCNTEAIKDFRTYTFRSSIALNRKLLFHGDRKSSLPVVLCIILQISYKHMFTPN